MAITADACKNCGNSCSSKANFCENCGVTVGRKTNQKVPADNASHYSRKKIFYTSIIAASFIAVAGSAFLVYITRHRQIEPGLSHTPAPSLYSLPASVEMDNAIRQARMAVERTDPDIKNHYEYYIRLSHRLLVEAISRVPDKTSPESLEAAILLGKVEAAVRQLDEEEKKRIAEEKKRMAAEAPRLRARLEIAYQRLIAAANPHLNFIGSKITKTKGGYAIWATHSFFNRYSFDAGNDAHLVKKWISNNSQLLEDAGIVRVGLMGDIGWCYFDL